MIYDVHAHIVPPALLPAIEADGARLGLGFDRSGIDVAVTVGDRSRGTISPGLLDVDSRLVAMDRAGVDVQLLSPWVGLMAYTMPVEQATRWSRLFNETLAELAGSRSDRFRGLAHVPMQHPDLAAAELEHAVASLGLAGAEITTTVDGAELDDPRFEPFWAAADALGCLLLIHPDRALPGRTKPRHHLANTVGNAAETTVAAVSLACGGVLQRHPSLRICLVHGGGFLPYQAGRIDHAYRAVPHRAGGALPHPPSHYLRRLYFDTVTHSPAALRLLIEFAGPGHVVLGSDHPFDMGDPTPVRTLQTVAGLTDDEFRLITEGNVEQLLRRPMPATP